MGLLVQMKRLLGSTEPEGGSAKPYTPGSICCQTKKSARSTAPPFSKSTERMKSRGRLVTGSIGVRPPLGPFPRSHPSAPAKGSATAVIPAMLNSMSA